ncbi:DNA-binding helix-turn-helix protein [Aneurinibacillus migulanus]|nr:DNA-binding helix-turn-helix protein [Aneurinibacillus migulanus]
MLRPECIRAIFYVEKDRAVMLACFSCSLPDFYMAEAGRLCENRGEEARDGRENDERGILRVN